MRCPRMQLTEEESGGRGVGVGREYGDAIVWLLVAVVVRKVIDTITIAVGKKKCFDHKLMNRV